MLGGCVDNRLKTNEAVLLNSPFTYQQFPVSAIQIDNDYDDYSNWFKSLSQCIPVKL